MEDIDEGTPATRVQTLMYIAAHATNQIRNKISKNGNSILNYIWDFIKLYCTQNGCQVLYNVPRTEIRNSKK
jgi:hypothetical protein